MAVRRPPLVMLSVTAVLACAQPQQGREDLGGGMTQDLAGQDLAGRDLAGRDLSSGNADLNSGGCPGKNLSTDPMNCGACNHVCAGSHVAVNGCQGGMCVVGTCAAGYFDVNSMGSDGCECQQDPAESTGSTQCAGAAGAGVVTDEPPGMLMLSGNIVPASDEDWYQVQAIDSPDPDGSCDKFHFKITFADNPGMQFRFDILYDDCATRASCDNSEVPTGLTTYEFVATGGPAGGTECPCNNASTTPTVHQCKDNSQTVRVRVYRIMSAPVSCDNYQLLVTNGM